MGERQVTVTCQCGYVTIVPGINGAERTYLCSGCRETVGITIRTIAPPRDGVKLPRSRRVKAGE